MTTRTDFESYLRGPAYILDDEADCLTKYAKICKGDAVEIGTGFGGSTTVLLINVPLKYKITSIDPFIRDSMGNWKASEEEALDGVARAVKKLMDPEISQKAIDRWTLKPIYSHDAFGDLNSYPQSLGLLFVDGDHRYNAIRHDVETFGALLKRGGYLLLHDSRRETELGDHTGYCRGWSGPTRVVKELSDGVEYTPIDFAGSITVLVKN